MPTPAESDRDAGAAADRNDKVQADRHAQDGEEKAWNDRGNRGQQPDLEIALSCFCLRSDHRPAVFTASPTKRKAINTARIAVPARFTGTPPT